MLAVKFGVGRYNTVIFDTDFKILMLLAFTSLYALEGVGVNVSVFYSYIYSALASESTAGFIAVGGFSTIGRDRGGKASAFMAVVISGLVFIGLGILPIADGLRLVLMDYVTDGNEKVTILVLFLLGIILILSGILGAKIYGRRTNG